LCDSSGDSKVWIEEGYIIFSFNPEVESRGFLMEKDQFYMKEAFKLASLGKEKVGINPMVGAIYVLNQTIIAQGYHRGFGDLHAEYDAFRVEDKDVTGATLYVTLEPCAHDDLYEACTKLVIKKKVKRVVIASLDPNPIEDGDGVKALKAAGIIVEVGVLKEQNDSLNQHYFKRFK
jgi:diaminohydroxyphosphoribosylaminopyrimidine deaminase/5-amino-6-(5-phosphoribosylamino)uracil reductase